MKHATPTPKPSILAPPPGSVPQTRAIFDGQHSLKFGTPATKFERLDGIVQAKTRNPHSQVLNPGTTPPGSVPQTRAIFDGQVEGLVPCCLSLEV